MVLRALTRTAGAGLSVMRNPTAAGAVIGGGMGFFSNDFTDPTRTLTETAHGALLGGLAGSLLRRSIGGAVKYAPGMARKALNVEGFSTAARFNLTDFAELRLAGRFSAMGPRTLADTQARSFLHQAGQTAPGAIVRGVGATTAAAGRFAERHPALVGGMVIGGGFAVMAAGMTPDEIAPQSPTLNNIEVEANFNQQAIAAEQMMMSAVAPMGVVGSANQMMGPFQRRLQESTTGLVQGLHRSRH